MFKTFILVYFVTTLIKKYGILLSFLLFLGKFFGRSESLTATIFTQDGIVVIVLYKILQLC